MRDGYEQPGKQLQENVRRQVGRGKKKWCRFSSGFGFSLTARHHTGSCKTTFGFDAGNDASCFWQYSLQADGQFLAFAGGRWPAKAGLDRSFSAVSGTRQLGWGDLGRVACQNRHVSCYRFQRWVESEWW